MNVSPQREPALRNLAGGRRALAAVRACAFVAALAALVTVGRSDAQPVRSGSRTGAAAARTPGAATTVQHSDPRAAAPGGTQSPDGHTLESSTEDPGGQPVDANTRLVVGQIVQIHWSTTWYQGNVVALNADGTVRVHYFGYAASSDENMARENLRVGGVIRVAPQTTAPANESILSSPRDPGGTTVTSPRQLAVNGEVQIHWGSTWYQGRVIGMQPDGTVRVHYRGYAASHDANVQITTLRVGGTIVPEASVSSGRDPGGQRINAATALRAGQPVQIRWHSTWYQGSVVMPNADGTVRIHYDGYGASSDEDVPRQRLRVGGTVRP